MVFAKSTLVWDEGNNLKRVVSFSAQALNRTDISIVKRKSRWIE
jgi:hypothetical protein